MIQKALPELQETTPVKDLYLEGGFYGSEVVKQAEDLGVKLHYTDMTGRNVTLDKLPYNVFSIEHFETILSCPKRHEPLRSNFKPESGILSAHFDLSTCTQCPVKEQ